MTQAPGPKPNNLQPPLPTADRDALRALVDRHGERRALEALGLSKQTLSRCLAGLGVHRGTAVLVRERLATACVIGAPVDARCK